MMRNFYSSQPHFQFQFCSIKLALKHSALVKKRGLAFCPVGAAAAGPHAARRAPRNRRRDPTEVTHLLGDETSRQ